MMISDGMHCTMLYYLAHNSPVQTLVCTVRNRTSPPGSGAHTGTMLVMTPLLWVNLLILKYDIFSNNHIQ